MTHIVEIMSDARQGQWWLHLKPAGGLAFVGCLADATRMTCTEAWLVVNNAHWNHWNHNATFKIVELASLTQPQKETA